MLVNDADAATASRLNLVSHTLSPTPCPHTLSPTPCLPHLVPTPCPHTLSPHLVSTPCLHTLSPHFVGYDSSPHFVPTLCQKLKRVRTGCLRLGFRKSLTLSRALSPLSKESIESMDSNDSILSDCSILSIRSTTTSRHRRHCHCLLPTATATATLLSPVPCPCPPPVPNHPARHPRTSSRYSNRRVLKFGSSKVLKFGWRLYRATLLEGERPARRTLYDKPPRRQGRQGFSL